MRRPIQKLLESNLSAQVRCHVARAGKICPRAPSVLEQGVTGFDRRAWPFGAKALHPVIPIGRGHLGPIPLGVLSDVLILHRLDSNTEFTKPGSQVEGMKTPHFWEDPLIHVPGPSKLEWLAR
jgi:hypothetical protein